MKQIKYIILFAICFDNSIIISSANYWNYSFTGIEMVEDTTSKISQEPTINELDWLHSIIIPLKSVEMSSDDVELKSIDSIVLNKSVIALGEVTHGSSQIYKMKDRLIKYLIEKKVMIFLLLKQICRKHIG